MPSRAMCPKSKSYASSRDQPPKTNINVKLMAFWYSHIKLYLKNRNVSMRIRWECVTPRIIQLLLKLVQQTSNNFQMSSIDSIARLIDCRNIMEQRKFFLYRKSIIFHVYQLTSCSKTNHMVQMSWFYLMFLTKSNHFKRKCWWKKSP